MTTVEKSRRFDAPPEEVWARIGDFHGLHTWHPAVENSAPKEDGAVRELSLAGGGTIVERLLDQGERSYSYRILESPLPVADYESTISVREDGGGSVVDWRSQFEPDGATEQEASAVISGIYEAGFDSL